MARRESRRHLDAAGRRQDDPVTRVLYTAFDVVPAPKGASTHIQHFVRALVHAGFEVDLVTPGDGILPEKDRFEGARVLRVPGEAGGNYLTRAVAFSRAVERHVLEADPYDVVHFRSIWGGLQLGRLRGSLGFRTLFEVNGLPSVELKYHYPTLRDTDLLSKMREQELATLALSDAIVCVSSVTRDYLVSLGVERERIEVIPNGVAVEEFEQCEETPFSTDRIPTFLYLGTLAEWQGLELLLDAWRIVAARRPIRLRVVGRGRSRQRKVLARRLRKLGLDELVSVEAPVPHHDVPSLFAGIDACVAPLLANDRNVTQGCCPIKVLEYMASGRPIVASNLPVVRELLREDIDARLFAPGDAADLAAQILRLADDPEKANVMAARALERVRAEFPWKRARRRLVRLYDERLDVRAGPPRASDTVPA
jgi:glycosyltransferase involved in cell wall biosynthesis